MKWISVEDRLPEMTDGRPPSSAYSRSIKQDVIVATKDGRVFQTSYSNFGWANVNSRTDYVTHWMPLPGPPEEP